MKTTTFILTIVIPLLFVPIVMAGKLSPELSSEISTMAGDSLVAVWIQLPKVKTESVKKSKSAALKTRAERYNQKYNSLKSSHKASQQQLLGSLNRLRASGKSTEIKSSWLANVVEAKIAAGELEKLARRNDIKTIYSVPELTLIKADNTQPQQIPSLSAGIEPNLIYINADQAWLAGFTGAGRLICSFDTGVEGDHPALFNSWKGHDGDSAAAWFDPRDGSSFPNTVLPVSHGTHTMGVMVGHDGNDTVGVALDARWISAAIVDIVGASYIDAFEWAANPDGNPNSMDDVPDVINHSWGIRDIGCQEVFYELIENLEALGIVNIFAAGNDGSEITTSTIRNPANRALDSIDCFAVGNISMSDPPSIAATSSRGPSDCNGAIKPNVCAAMLEPINPAPPVITYFIYLSLFNLLKFATTVTTSISVISG